MPEQMDIYDCIRQANIERMSEAFPPAVRKSWIQPMADLDRIDAEEPKDPEVNEGTELSRVLGNAGVLPDALEVGDRVCLDLPADQIPSHWPHGGAVKAIGEGYVDVLWDGHARALAERTEQLTKVPPPENTCTELTPQMMPRGAEEEVAPDAEPCPECGDSGLPCVCPHGEVPPPADVKLAVRWLEKNANFAERYGHDPRPAIKAKLAEPSDSYRAYVNREPRDAHLSYPEFCAIDHSQPPAKPEPKGDPNYVLVERIDSALLAGWPRLRVVPRSAQLLKEYADQPSVYRILEICLDSGAGICHTQEIPDEGEL